MPLPSWLADFDPDRLHEPEKAQSESLFQDTEPKEVPDEKEKDYTAKLVTELRFCETPSDIRKLFAGLEVNVQAQPWTSRMAFQHLLDGGSSILVLFTFLEDAFLNTLQAGNFWLFLSDKRFKSRHSRDFLQQWICDQAALGMFTPTDLTSIIRFALIPENAELWFHLAVKVWEGTKKSSVLTTQDLQPEALTMLLKYLSNPLISKKRRYIGLKVIITSESSQLDDTGSEISKFLESSMWPEKLSKGSQQGTEYHYDRFSRSTKIFKAIARLPADLACSCAANVSKRFVERCQENNEEEPGYKDALKIWWATIDQHRSFSFVYHSSQWRNLEKYLYQQGEEIVRPYLLSLSTEPLCQFFVRCKLRVPQSTIDQVSISAPPIDDSQTLSPMGQTATPITVMIKILEATVRNYQKPISQLFTFLRELGAFTAIVEIVEEAGPIMNRGILIAEITELSQANLNAAYEVFRACPWLPLESCPDLAIRLLLMHERGHPEELFRLRRLHWRTCDRVAIFGPNPQVAVSAQHAFYHRIALAIARCPRVRPRAAFSWVYHCYMTVVWRKRLGGVGPEMTRALTHAGITRKLQAEQWVSTEQIGWILSKVQEVEGEEVAHQLDELVYEWRGEVLRKNAERIQQRKSPEARKWPEARISQWRYQ